MHNEFTIGVTGAGGHIGSRICKYLRANGFQVVAFTGKVASVDVPSRRYDLSESITDDLFSGIDVLVHCAYVSQQQHPHAYQINVNGSKRLFEACRKQGVKKIIFFSSVTADTNATSGYAKSKFQIAQLLDNDRDFIIRCSMVVGSGGLFQRMLNYTVTHTFIPIIGSGNQIIQVVAIDDVVRFVEQVIIQDLHGTGVLANNEELTYRKLFSLIAAVYRKKIVFVPVPAAVLRIILRLCNLLHIQTGASVENIQGILGLSKYEPLMLLQSYKTVKEKLNEMRATSPPSVKKE